MSRNAAERIEASHIEILKPEDEGAREQRGPARSYPLIAASELFAHRAEPAMVIDKLFEVNSSIGIVGPPESGKSLLVLNAAACVATHRDCHGRAVDGGLSIYLAGEGFHGLGRRLQALERRYQLGIQNAPLLFAKTSASLIDASEANRVRDAIGDAQSKFGPLRLLVVDTLARFVAPGDENSSRDMGAFLAAVDALRGDATALILHHPGHGEGGRARGSSAWRAGLDAEFVVTKVGDVITVTCSKMKDAEAPAPFSFRIETESTLSARADGSPIQSVVLVPTDLQPVVAKATGKNQKRLLAELERRSAEPGQAGIWTEGELREIGRESGMHRNSSRDAVLGLRQLGYLTATVGGSRLSHQNEMTERPKPARDRASVGTQMTETAPASLEAVHSCMSSGHEDPCEGVAA